MSTDIYNNMIVIIRSFLLQIEGRQLIHFFKYIAIMLVKCLCGIGYFDLETFVNLLHKVTYC